jgi:hypothetical protein
MKTIMALAGTVFMLIASSAHATYCYTITNMYLCQEAENCEWVNGYCQQKATTPLGFPRVSAVMTAKFQIQQAIATVQNLIDGYQRYIGDYSNENDIPAYWMMLKISEKLFDVAEAMDQATSNSGNPALYKQYICESCMTSATTTKMISDARVACIIPPVGYFLPEHMDSLATEVDAVRTTLMCGFIACP